MNNIFGQNYEEIGSKDKGLILKSSGKIKIQWGKKFIDLIDSNGNLKVKESIKSVSSLEDIKENGFYYLDNSLIARINGETLKIFSNEENDIYISFINEQDTSEEQKKLAQKNIGLIYETQSENNKYPTDGLVYIVDEQELYKVINGNLVKYDQDKKKNLEITDKLKINDLEISSQQNNSVYNTSNEHIFNINDVRALNINSEGIFGNGFSITNKFGESVLTVDKINSNSLINEDILDTLVCLYSNSQLTASIQQNTNIVVNSNLVWYIDYGQDSLIRGYGNKTVPIESELLSSTSPINIKVYDIIYLRLIEPYDSFEEIPDDIQTILNLHYKELTFNN